MISIEEAGRVRSEKADNIGPNMTASNAISLPQGQFRWKPVPRMSEEMVNVMSSFNMIDVSKSDTLAKDNTDSRETEASHSSRDSKEDVPYGNRRNSSFRGKNLLPIKDGAKHTFHKVGKVTTPRVHTPEMKAKLQQNGHNFRNEKQNEIESQSNGECCSSKTQQLLARSSLLYGRIDNLRERAKLTRSASLQSSENKIISAIKEQVAESCENDFEFTEVDALEIKPSRSKITRSSKQRILQKSMSDSHEEQKASGVHNLRMPPILKSRSHTIL